MSYHSGTAAGQGARELSDRPMRGILDQIERCAQADEVSLGDLLQSFGTASFVSAMLVPALLLVSPLSGIPLFSSLCGLTIATVAAQMLLRRSYLYLPGTFTRRRMPGERLRDGVGRMRRVADFVDRHTRRGRLGVLVGEPGRALPQSLCLLAGLTIPVMELVPFSSSLLGAAVLFLSVALLTRDGVFVLAGMTILGAVGSLPFLIL